MLSVPITACRVCGGKLELVGSLGDIAVSDFGELPFEPVRLPLDMKFCESCSLPQLGHNFDRSVLYDKYWYRSALNPTIVADLKEIARWGKGTHIDIGANDGTLLQYSRATRKIAVDPSDISPGDVYTHKEYWEDVGLDEKADLITAIACLYDLPDPTRFMRNVKRHLKDDGVFIAQLMTLEPMLENNDVGNICHEHLEYYSYRSLQILCAQADLEIFKVERNGMNGGSYRLYIKHRVGGSIDFYEPSCTAADLERFFGRVTTNRARFLQWKQDRGIIVGYGASTKMATIVDYYGYSPGLVVDVNEDKIGKFTVAGAAIIDHIPEGTDWLWAFPYGFLENFRKRETNYGGGWVTTMPRLIANR